MEKETNPSAEPLTINFRSLNKGFYPKEMAIKLVMKNVEFKLFILNIFFPILKA